VAIEVLATSMVFVGFVFKPGLM